MLLSENSTVIFFIPPSPPAAVTENEVLTLSRRGSAKLVHDIPGAGVMSTSANPALIIVFILVFDYSRGELNTALENLLAGVVYAHCEGRGQSLFCFDRFAPLFYLA